MSKAVTINIDLEAAESVLEFLNDNSDVNCWEGPMLPSDEYVRFREAVAEGINALRDKAIRGRYE